ncbi:hypothetical protein ACFL1B_05600 [Nanoarchaeota archaeon]
MILAWILIFLNGLLSFIGRRYIKMITLEINGLAIAIIALAGGNVLLYSFLLVGIYTIITIEDIFSAIPKIVLTIITGYIALLTGLYWLPILFYYAGNAFYLLLTSQFGPPAVPYLLTGTLGCYFILKIVHVFM